MARAFAEGVGKTARATRVRARRLPVGRPADADGFVPWWLPWLFVLLGVVLAPWIVWLIVSLPSEQIANHWAVAWAGFDVALAVILVATGVTLARRSPAAEVLAAMAGAFLICDAWFDTMTSRGTTTVVVAILEAVLVELPLAVVCLWIARNFERVLTDAVPFLRRAGFRLDGRRLVPPESTD